MGSIFSHIFIRSSFNNLNQLVTSVMDAIDERFEVIVPSHGLTQKLALYVSHSLDASFWFNILDLLLRRHSVSRLMVIIYPKSSGLSLVQLWGGGPKNILSFHLPMSNWVRYVIPYPHNIGCVMFSSYSHLPI